MTVYRGLITVYMLTEDIQTATLTPGARGKRCYASIDASHRASKMNVIFHDAVVSNGKLLSHKRQATIQMLTRRQHSSFAC